MNKFTFKFYLNEDKAKGNLFPIYLRITVNRKKVELSTGHLVEAKAWDVTKARTKHNLTINHSLNDTENDVYKAVRTFEIDGKPYDANDIKKYLKQGEEVIYLAAYFEDYIQKITRAGEVKNVTLGVYAKSLGYLKEFIEQEYKKLDFLLAKVDYKFVSAFDQFLAEKGLHRNTVNKYHKRLKTVLIRAFNEVAINRNPYQDFKIKTVSSKRTFLTRDELDRILNHRLADNESLKRVRDIFIFSVYTGLRFADGMSLNMKELITDDNGDTFLLTYQKKTTEPVMIPVFTPAKAIIEKYDNDERKITGLVLPKISNQKVNAYLKTIGDLAGIEKPLTHHVARHTFATTILLDSGASLPATGKLLGHTSLKATQAYGKVSKEQLKGVMKKVESKLF